MLAQFPSRDVDELATKEFVAAQVADVRAEIADVRVLIAQQTDRLMTRMQITVGMAFGFFALITVLTR